jgi:single-stranded-DNA-specific exonuclease
MKWHLKEKVPTEFIEKFPEYPPLVLQLLYDRGMDTQEKIDEFFNPDYLEDLHDPFLMMGMKEAVERIVKAIKKQEKISVFADYDCDGVCGGVILETALKALGADLGDIYIPDRHKEGFGLNEKAVRELKEKGAELIITVDCGIVNCREVELANKLGMEVIITDHHLPSDKLPKAIIVNPNQKGDRYPFKDLAGAGVVFKLVQGLLKKNNKGILEGWEKWLLDLVALATVADMVSLLGENRTLVRYGLIVMAQTKRPGMKELMRVAGLNPIFEKKEIPTTENVGQLVSRIETGRYFFTTNLRSRDLGFILAPRINVASSLAHANIAYELLSTKSGEEAKLLAEKLNGINESKYKVINEVIGDIEKRLAGKKMGKIIFEASDKWPAGVIRWAAQKFRDKYSRPVFIFNITDGKAKGSIRSPKQFNVVEAMKECSEFLDQFGGHPCSAGCRLKEENLEEFRLRLKEAAERKLKEEDLEPSLDIDYLVGTNEISWQSYDLAQSFSPFGKDNPHPLFALSGAEIVNMRQVGNGDKHLKLELELPTEDSSGIKKIQAIGFNHGIKFDDLKNGDKVDIVFEFLANEWNGTRNLELKIIDLKITTPFIPSLERRGKRGG